MVVVISVVVTSSDVIIFLCLILALYFFTNSIVSATILTIFDQVEAWFSRTDKRSVYTTVWFTCATFFSSGSSGVMAGVLVLVFQVSSGSQKESIFQLYLCCPYWFPYRHNLQDSLLCSHNATFQLQNVLELIWSCWQWKFWFFWTHYQSFPYEKHCEC